MIPPALLSRRTALVGLGAAGLAAATGAGCSVRVPGRKSTTTPTPTPRPGGVEPDVQLVVDLVESYTRSVAQLTDTRARHPRLAARLAPMLALLRAQLTVLRRAAPADSLGEEQPAAGTVPALAPRALRTVLAGARALRSECFESSGRAESGQFARLLAGMGAGLSQRLVAFQVPPAVGARMSTEPTTTGIEPLQGALAGEHAAVYVFGVLAAQTSESVQPKTWADLDAAYEWHRARRDALVARITAGDETPVAAAASYRLPNAAANADQVLRAALATERRVTDTYGALVARTTEGLRRWAMGSLDESAVRQLRFRGTPEMAPGTGGLAAGGSQDR